MTALPKSRSSPAAAGAGAKTWLYNWPSWAPTFILTYRSQQAEAAAVVAQIEALGRRAVALPLDAANISTFESFFAQVTEALANTFGTDGFAFLINNAGTSLLAPFAETTEAQLDELVNTNLKSVYFLTQRALLLLGDRGRIINISSAAARSSFTGNSV